MDNYFMPTRVISGVGCFVAQAQLIKELGKKALIVTGRTSSKINGSLSEVTTCLNDMKMPYIIYDQVMANPDIACVYEGAQLAKSEAVDLVIAIGGGSPLDAAKAIALLARQDIKEEELFKGQYSEDVLPIIAIPTTAGTGSEVTQYAILTNDNVKSKTSIATPYIFPKMAFLDPTYMMALPLVTTIHTAVDALSHSIEGILSVKASPISDALALRSIERLSKQFPKLIAMKDNDEMTLSLEEREELLNASTLGGMVIAQTGTTVVHAMGYSLTYFHDIDHGRANGLLLGSFMQYLLAQGGEAQGRVNQILSAMGVMSIEAYNTMIEALIGCERLLKSDEILLYSDLASKTRNILNCCVQPTQDEIEAMYTVVRTLT